MTAQNIHADLKHLIGLMLLLAAGMAVVAPSHVTVVEQLPYSGIFAGQDISMVSSGIHPGVDLTKKY
jgi:hypothetical protein